MFFAEVTRGLLTSPYKGEVDAKHRVRVLRGEGGVVMQRSPLGEGFPYGIWRLVTDERRNVVPGQPRPPIERREFDEDGDARDDRS